MYALRELDLGSIIRHTTDNTCRVWIRGADPGDRGVLLHPNRRTYPIRLVQLYGTAI